MSLTQTEQPEPRTTQMRVIEVAQFGGPEVLRAVTAPAPVAGHGEVVIEVAAADVIFR